MSTGKNERHDWIEESLKRIRSVRPMIHCITNYVTINDVANVLLAAGARPVMADDPMEAAEITAGCRGLTINMGTLHRHTIPAMEQAGRKAAELGHSIVLDPVGAGSSSFRLKTALDLLKEIPFTAVRGNLSEIRSLACEKQLSTGVDQCLTDRVTEENLAQMAEFIRGFSRMRHCITVITGQIDLVSDGRNCCAVYNGRPEMAFVTGTGCQLSALLSAFLSVSGEISLDPGKTGASGIKEDNIKEDNIKENNFWSAVAAVGAMGLAGEIAWAGMQPGEGNGTCRNRIIDAIYCMTGDQLAEGIRYEVL